MEVTVYNMAGEKTGTTNLPDMVFGLPWNAALVQQVLDAERTNARANTAHAKDRSEVSGGGKKPWRQKGTGRARHGSSRSPIWIGGGVTHGPRNERVYDKKINKQARRKALLVSLSGKARDGEVVLLQDLVIPEGRTRYASGVFHALASSGVTGIGRKGGSALVALADANGESTRALRNLPYVSAAEARNLTARQVLAAKYLVFPKAALPVLERFVKSKKRL